MMITFHPLANLFPLIEGTEFDTLVEDIRENGLREKIVKLGGEVLDGRNRYRAGMIAEVVPAHGQDEKFFRDFDPAIDGTDPLKFVLSKNLARRHMNESQRAMVASRVATLRQGEKQSSKPANLPVTAQGKAAENLNVSERLVRSAKTVQQHGTPELVKAVDHGHLAVSAAAQASKLPVEQQREIARKAEAGEANVVRTVIKQGLRNEREKTLGAKQQALPDKKFGVILADPEHRFEVWSRQTGLDRGADNHYPTTEQRLLLMREIHKIAAKDCVCGLWVTDLARGIRMLENWGFEFKSYFVWVKDIVPGPVNADGHRTFVEVGPAGTGYWNRDRDELFLIGTRGNIPCPAPGTQGESVWFAARPHIEGSEQSRHSAKPENAHLWMEKHFPNLPKIELNARKLRPGWEAWGNEAPDEIPESATEAAAAIGGKSVAPLESAPDAFPADGAEAEENHLALEPVGQTSDPGVTGGESAAPSNAEIFAAAKALVINDQNGSTSYVQRKLNLTYNNAYAILDLLEQQGVVSQIDARGARQVLIERERSTPQQVPAAPSPQSKSDDFEIPAFLRRAPEGP